MAAQLSFDFNVDIKVVKKKRVRYLVPTYIKFYTVYQYDRQKFTKLLKEWLRTPEGRNRTLTTLKQKQDEILAECWLYDDEGRQLRDSDENHIYRFGTLERLYEQIYYEIGANPFIRFERTNIDDLTIWGEEKQAEIKDTCYLPLKERVKLHIKLLRLLRKGFSVEESIERLRK